MLIGRRATSRPSGAEQIMSICNKSCSKCAQNRVSFERHQDAEISQLIRRCLVMIGDLQHLAYGIQKKTNSI